MTLFVIHIQQIKCIREKNRLKLCEILWYEFYNLFMTQFFQYTIEAKYNVYTYDASFQQQESYMLSKLYARVRNELRH